MSFQAAAAAVTVATVIIANAVRMDDGSVEAGPKDSEEQLAEGTPSSNGRDWR